MQLFPRHSAVMVNWNDPPACGWSIDAQARQMAELPYRPTEKMGSTRSLHNLGRLREPVLWVSCRA